MTTEQEMYEEIMHKMPHRIYEFIKAVDEVQKMLERKGYGKLNDNLDQLKIALEKAQKEQENIYSAVYDKKDFEMILPKTYNQMINNFIDSGYMEDIAINQFDYLTERGEDWITEEILNDYEPADDSCVDLMDCYIAQNTDFIQLCEHYYSEEYGSNFSDYINENSDFDFDRFCKETDFENDIMYDLQNAVLTDDRIYQQMKNIRESYKEEEQQYYEDKYKDYSEEELNEEIEYLREQPIYANNGHDEEIQREANNRKIGYAQKALNDKDIDYFINSFSDDKTTTADKTAQIKFTDDFER